MKFLCDRCKTRYSIADERVRGKILKIRCKNCANVISVREGMTDEDASVADAPSASPAASGSALQNAFASVMVGTRPGETQPPPPVLEEEWYVAIDGNQAGPFTLAEAQTWVGGKQPLDDLYCWCEGFDDWLPVEKVSHFRGLRGRREETPRPRAPTASRAAVASAAAAKAPAATAAAKKETKPQPKEQIDEEPKPLFAATLAKLEAEAAKKDDAPADKKAADKKPAEKVAEKKPADKKPADKKPGDKAADAKDDKPPARGPGSLSPLSPVSPRAPLPMPTRAAAPIAAASPAPLARAGAQAAVASARTPLAALAREEANQAPALAPAPTPAPKPVAGKGGSGGSRRPMFDTGEREPDHDEGEALDDSALESDDGDEAAKADGLDLDIGEVSRVVRLPDLMAAGRPSGGRAAARPMGRMSGAAQAIGRGSGAAPAIGAVAGAAALGGAMQQGPDGEALPPLSDAVLADAQPQLVPSVSNRRNHHVMWLIGGAVMLLGVVVVIAVAASASGADEGPVSTGNLDVTGLGYSYDPLRPHGSGGDTGSGGGSVAITGVHIIRHNQGSGGTNGSQQFGTGSQGTGRQEIGPNGEPIEPLTGDDIVNVSNRMSMGTARCYERALKKDPFLKVQKIMVSLKVDATGLVTDVALDSHTTDDLGQCIMGAIRRWPFRRSTEGINTVFPLVFQQGG